MCDDDGGGEPIGLARRRHHLAHFCVTKWLGVEIPISQYLQKGKVYLGKYTYLLF